MNISNYIGDIELCEQICSNTDIKDVWSTTIHYLENKEICSVKSKLPLEVINMIPNYDYIKVDELVYRVNVIRRLISASTVYKPLGKVFQEKIIK